MKVRASHGWGGTNKGVPTHIFTPTCVDNLIQSLSARAQDSFLVRGFGRSYGDSALNSGGSLIDLRFLDRFLSFDTKSGVLECEAGVSIAAINELFANKGWMLPVVPGTQFVTIGGAIANDVHGKNHVLEGSFGTHLISMKLVQSNGEIQDCSLQNNIELFKATIAGLGLTGVVVTAKLQLRPIQSLSMRVNHIPFKSLAELISLAEGHLESWEYHAAWMDPDAACRKGLYIVANHSDEPGSLDWPGVRALPLGPLVDLTSDLPGRLFMKAANTWYRRAIGTGMRQASIKSVLYPLDRIPDWNALFGKPGFFQHQSVIPEAVALKGLDELLKVVDKSGQAVSLAVGKWFGSRRSPGLLSFPAPGFSLAMDFANRGESTLRLLDDLDKVVADCGGRPYPAKDARMQSALFSSAYPELEEFRKHTDPHFVSDFWRRMEKST